MQLTGMRIFAGLLLIATGVSGPGLQTPANTTGSDLAYRILSEATSDTADPAHDETTSDVEHGDGGTDGTDSGADQDADHAQAADHTTDTEHEEHVHSYISILYLFFMVTCGMLVATIQSKKPAFLLLPYTVFMFVVGVIFGAIHIAASGYDGATHTTKEAGLGVLSDSMEMWINIDAHLLLFAFLPGLVFADSMSINWHTFKAVFIQAATLAGPGVVMGTLMMAALAYYVLPYGCGASPDEEGCWSFSLCVAVGSILSATDPVAVVGLLKAMGCPKFLQMQIAGEAGLNDGVALVIFIAFWKLAKGEDWTAADVALYFLRLALGGVAVGFIFGNVSLYWLAHVSDRLKESHGIIQISLTIATGYLVFFTCEEVLEVSGVLGVLYAGIGVAKSGWPLFNSAGGMEEVWHTVEFYGNTLLFMLAGTITGKLVAVHAVCDSDACSNIEAQDYAWTLLFYVFMVLGRALMLLVVYPVLKFSGPGVSFSDCVVIWWGGLRGAVGLALAIMVDNDASENRIDTKQSSRIMLLVAGCAFLTLVVNAPTAELVVRKLGIIDQTKSKKKILDHLELLTQAAVREHVDALLREDRYKGVNVADIKKWVHWAYTDEVIERAKKCGGAKITSAIHALEMHAPDNVEDHYGDPTKPEMADKHEADLQEVLKDAPCMLKESRSLFYSILRGTIWNFGSSGYLPRLSRASTVLLHAIDIAEDYADSRSLCDFEFLRQVYAQPPWTPKQGHFVFSLAFPIVHALHELNEGTFVNRDIEPFVRQGVVIDLYTFLILLDAHRRARFVFGNAIGETQQTAMAVAKKRVMSESLAEENAIINFLAKNHVTTEMCWRSRTKQLALRVLVSVKNEVLDWVEHGILNAIEAEELLHHLHGSLRLASQPHSEWKTQDSSKVADFDASNDPSSSAAEIRDALLPGVPQPRSPTQDVKPTGIQQQDDPSTNGSADKPTDKERSHVDMHL
uniref:Cation/H+ exchanger transmembrane domain-containing protein n=1 Tax=Oxyrrhis marina TaxID=2969 RepID=A0A7S4GL03_OXYMA